MSNSATLELPTKLECLFKPRRYKVLYGGRGGAKSWGIARALLVQGAARPLRILCTREFQNSISDSVHKLLSDQIAALGLSGFYEIQRSTIIGRNGTEFIFAGLRHNIGSLKSYEGVDIVWVEEADNVSKTSWETLIPTIRKNGSEIWVSFNPKLETDETYRRFVISPPADSVVVRVNWSDNPWFPDVLRAEMQEMKERDPDAWLNVWEGNCRRMLDGAVYAAELRKAEEEGRIRRVPIDHTKPIHTFWDLGWADNTAIWFAQVIAGEFRCVDYLEDSQKPLAHYQKLLQDRGYIYGTDWLPHDARAKQLGTGRSIEELLRAAGRNVRIVPNLSVEDGINAARTVFPQIYIDVDKCADGIQCLRHYRYESDPDTQTLSRKPLHDQYSHGADAFRYLAVALKEPVKKIERKPAVAGYGERNGWMA